MAAPACNSDDGNPAIFVGTFLQDGSAVALCEDCLPQFCVAVAAQTQGIEVEALAAAVVALAAESDDTEPEAPQEVAYPPHDTTHGAPTDEPPPPAPADEDPGAGWDVTSPPQATGLTSNGSAAPGTAGVPDDGEPPPKTTRKPRTPAQ
jgi:hypothetical protein